VYDGATPSGNAVMAVNLQYLAVIFNKEDWKQQSLAMLQSLQNAALRYPTSFGVWASLYQNLIMGLNEVVITGTKTALETNLSQVLRLYIPNKIVQSAAENLVYEFPLLVDKIHDKDIQFFLCENYSCSLPQENFTAFLHLCNTKSLILA